MGPLSILPSEVAEQYRPSAGQTLDVQGDGDPFARTERWPVRSARQHHLRGGRDPESHDLARPIKKKEKKGKSCHCSRRTSLLCFLCKEKIFVTKIRLD